MENGQGPIASLVDKAEAFTKTSYELYKLKAIDKSAEVVSSIASNLPAAIAAIFFATMVNIGLSLWLGKILGAMFLGFFAVAGFYLLAGLILFVFRKQIIKKPVSNSIIKSALN